jgi:hypothetical protein
MAFLCLLKVTGYLKTFIKIMVSLQFHDVEDDTVLSIQVNDSEHSLTIYLESEYEEISWGISMDKSTAIKFSKELRKQIALID